MYRPTLPNELPPWFFEQARNKKKHTTPAIKWPEALRQVGHSKEWQDYKDGREYENWRKEPARSWNQVRQHLASVNSTKPKDEKPMTWREAQRELKRQKQAKKLTERKAKKRAKKPAQETPAVPAIIPPPPPPKPQEISVIPIAPTPAKIKTPTMPVFSDASHDEYIPSNATLFDPRDGRNEIPSKTYPIPTSRKTEQPLAIKTEIQHPPTPQKISASTSPFSIIPQSLLTPFPPITKKAIEKIIHKNHLNITPFEVIDSMAVPWWACATDTSFDELHSCDISSLIQRILDEQNFITPKSVRETTPDNCWKLEIPMRMRSPIFKVMREYIGMQRNLDDIFSMIFFQAHSRSKLSPFGAGVLIIDHTTTNIFCFFDPLIHTNTYQQVEHSELFGIQLKYDMLREIFKKSNYATDRSKIYWERAVRKRNGRIVAADIIHFDINSIVAPIEEDKKYYFYLRAFYQNKKNNRPLYPIRNVVLDVNECKKRLSSKAIPVSQYMPYSTGFIYNHALFTLKSANIPGLLKLLDRKNVNENGPFYVEDFKRDKKRKNTQQLNDEDREMQPGGEAESLLVPEPPKVPSTALSPIPPTPEKLVEDTPFIQTTTRQRPFEYQTKPYSLHPPHYPEETNRNFARKIQELEQQEQREVVILSRMPQELKQKIEDIEDWLTTADYHDTIKKFIQNQFIIEVIARQNAAVGVNKILIKGELLSGICPLWAFINAMNTSHYNLPDQEDEFLTLHRWTRLKKGKRIMCGDGEIDDERENYTFSGLLDNDFYRQALKILQKTLPGYAEYVDFRFLVPPPALQGKCFVYMLAHDANNSGKAHTFIWKIPQRQEYYGELSFRIPIWMLKKIANEYDSLQKLPRMGRLDYKEFGAGIFSKQLPILAETIVSDQVIIYHFPIEKPRIIDRTQENYPVPSRKECKFWPVDYYTFRSRFWLEAAKTPDGDFSGKIKAKFTKAFNLLLATGKIDTEMWQTVIEAAKKSQANKTLANLYNLFSGIYSYRSHLYLDGIEYNTIQAAKLLEIIRPLLPKQA